MTSSIVNRRDSAKSNGGHSVAVEEVLSVVVQISFANRYTPEIFLFSTATFKYTYRAPLRRIGKEYSANVAFSIIQSLKRIQSLPKHLPLTPLRLNVFRLFVILSLPQLYRYTPEILLFSTATFKYNYRAPLRRIGQEYCLFG
jgi:hypothetical protein